MTYSCPKCGPGYPMVKTESIGLGKGGWICPMNMPYQGCGFRTNGIPPATPTKTFVVRKVPVEWRTEVTCGCGKRMSRMKNCHWGCKCGNQVHYDQVDLR